MSEPQSQSAGFAAANRDHKSISEHACATAERAVSSAGVVAQDAARHFVGEPALDLLSMAKKYARANPDVAACWAFGLGVVVGWKLRP